MCWPACSFSDCFRLLSLTRRRYRDSDLAVRRYCWTCSHTVLSDWECCYSVLALSSDRGSSAATIAATWRQIGAWTHSCPSRPPSQCSDSFSLGSPIYFTETFCRRFGKSFGSGLDCCRRWYLSSKSLAKSSSTTASYSYSLSSLSICCSYLASALLTTNYNWSKSSTHYHLIALSLRFRGRVLPRFCRCALDCLTVGCALLKHYLSSSNQLGDLHSLRPRPFALGLIR